MWKGTEDEATGSEEETTNQPKQTEPAIDEGIVVINEDEGKKATTEHKDSLLSPIQKFLPIIPVVGIFTVLCYFLGRLHIEAYYYALGISPHVLSFQTNDYIFSSFYLVMMCLMISIWLYLYWVRSRSGKTISRKNTVIISILWMLSAALLYFSPIFVGLYVTGMLSIITGFLYGYLLYIFASYLQSSVKKLPKDSNKQQISIIIMALILVVIFFFGFLPMITNNLASVQAKSDIMTKFPRVTVICKDEFPIQLQSSSSNSTNSVEGQLIITNNEITYVLQSDNTVYAIPVDSIKNIIYTKK